MRTCELTCRIADFREKKQSIFFLTSLRLALSRNVLKLKPALITCVTASRALIETGCYRRFAAFLAFLR